MSTSLERFVQTPTSQAKALSDLPPGELRRQVLRALQDRGLEFLNALLGSYLHLHARAASPHTLRAYFKSLELFLDDAPFSVLQPGRDDALFYVRALEERGLKPSSVSVRVAALRAFYAALIWAGALAENPFIAAKPKRDKDNAAHKRKPYSTEELGRLLQVADSSERVLLLLLAHGGLRISEALALERRDLDFEAHQLRVRHGKGDKPRQVVLSPRLQSALEGFDYGLTCLFTWDDRAARYRMKKLCARAEVDGTGRKFHSLRHYCGTELMRRTKNLVVVKEHLGHSNVNTAALYAKLVDTELSDALEDF